MNYYATLIVVGSLVLLSSAFLAPADAALTCELTETKPTFNPSQLEAINSQDNLLLAKMSAYLEFYENFTTIEDGQKYLKLRLEKVILHHNYRLLYIFKTDCADIMMLANPGESAYMSVILARTIKDTISCNVFPSYKMPAGHLECSPRAFPCYRKDERSPVAVITFAKLEYEASYDLDMHRTKQFAGPKSIC